MSDLDNLARDAQAVVDAITQDDMGTMVAGVWMGGNGGLLSRETLIKTDQLRKTLLEVKAQQKSEAAS